MMAASNGRTATVQFLVEARAGIRSKERCDYYEACGGRCYVALSRDSGLGTLMVQVSGFWNTKLTLI